MEKPGKIIVFAILVIKSKTHRTQLLDREKLTALRTSLDRGAITGPVVD